MKMNTTILIVTTLFSGLMAGLFYAWSISVTPGLAKISDVGYLQAFQSMNRAILNPVFFIVFFGLIVLLPALCYLYYQSTEGNQLLFIASATGLYLFGVMAITIFGNIPLNNTLEVLQIEFMTPDQMDLFRQGFERKWNNFNTIRTICSSLALLSLVIACIKEFGK